MLKNILVCDLYYTERIAQNLKMFYGNEANILQIESRNLLFELSHFENKSEIKDINLFFISGALVVEKEVNIDKLKEKYGTESSKVVVMSTESCYLNLAKKKYGGDYFYLKERIYFPDVKMEDLSSNEKLLLNFYLTYEHKED